MGAHYLPLYKKASAQTKLDQLYEEYWILHFRHEDTMLLGHPKKQREILEANFRQEVAEKQAEMDALRSEWGLVGPNGMRKEFRREYELMRGP